MRPLDPRLLKHAQAVRTYLLLTAAIGTSIAATAIAQAYFLGDLLAGVFVGSKSASNISISLAALLGLALARSALTWLSDWSAHRASAQTKNALRTQAAHKITELGPVWVSSQRGSYLTTTLLRGLDSLDVYFARYLPQLILAVVIPLAFGVVILTQDVLSAVIVALTIPLIPFFMALIGWFTQAQVDKQWKSLQRLAGHFLDLINGLPTLKAFNRSKGQQAGLAVIGEEYRSATMSVLRISFLSSLVLELISTLSVALVAVSIGLRLVDGKMGLREGLIVLILIPDVYLPLRTLGAQFHAMTEGLEAADSVLSILDEPVVVSAGTTVLSQINTIEFSELSVTYKGFTEPGLKDFSGMLERQKLNVLTGSSGVGKSSALNSLMGFVAPSAGEILIAGIPLKELEIKTWRNQIAYLPQIPWLPVGSIRDAMRMVGEFSDLEIIEVCNRVGLDLYDSQQFPHGLNTSINVNSGASTGQRRRIALARTLLLQKDIIILDEPSAAVDSETETKITQVIQELVVEGRFVIVVAHRPAMIAAGTNTIHLQELVKAK